MMNTSRRLAVTVNHLSKRCMSSSAGGYGGSQAQGSVAGNNNDNNNNRNGNNNSVLIETVGNKGVITLNRPKALNALNLDMIRIITPILRKWVEEEKALVIIKGTGDKAFCAGGDVRAVIEAGGKQGSLTRDFFREEYQLNYLISTLAIPYCALIDGITMGGGVGLSVHGYYRVATERTVFAMPETAIGFFPDVGGTYFLPRLRGKLGLFLALTGYRLKGADVFHAGIATHGLGSEHIRMVEEELLALKPSPQALDVERCLGKYTKEAPFLQKSFSLTPHLDLIDETFAGETVEEIVHNLEKADEPFAKEVLATLKKMSPLSLKVTKRALDEGADKTLAECLQMEFRLSQRFCQDHDFAEGVRALLVDKHQSPKWKPSRLEDCSPEYMDCYFAPLSEDQELHL